MKMRAKELMAMLTNDDIGKFLAVGNFLAHISQKGGLDLDIEIDKKEINDKIITSLQRVKGNRQSSKVDFSDLLYLFEGSVREWSKNLPPEINISDLIDNADKTDDAQ